MGIKTPLILAFGLYFIFQHSLNAWGHLQHGLKIDGFTLYKKALPFTLSAIFFLCAMLFYNSVAVLNLNEFIATLFENNFIVPTSDKITKDAEIDLDQEADEISAKFNKGQVKSPFLNSGYFIDGVAYDMEKDQTICVRAVRAF